jgi:hypothetical protein
VFPGDDALRMFGGAAEAGHKLTLINAPTWETP